MPLRFKVYRFISLFSCCFIKEDNFCDFSSDNIYIKSDIKLDRQIVGIPMSTICDSLKADLFSFCCERDFMTFPSDDKQAEIIQAFNSTSRYLEFL